MKRLVIIFAMLFLIFLSAKAENTKGIKIEITIAGGKVIKNGEYKGELGYEKVSTIETRIDGDHVFKIRCSGKGVIRCPNKAIATVVGSLNYPSPEQLDVIYAIIERDIDIGKTAGEFKIEGFLCTWNEGKKEIDEEEKIPVYGYRLVITDEIPVKMDIQIFPNPAHNHIIVRFSMPINAMINVKIVDEMGNTHWNSDMHVSGNELYIDKVDFLLQGMYYIVCTKNENVAYAKFFKLK
jgi:hypothetical protein